MTQEVDKNNVTHFLTFYIFANWNVSVLLRPARLDNIAQDSDACHVEMCTLARRAHGVASYRCAREAALLKVPAGILSCRVVDVFGDSTLHVTFIRTCQGEGTGSLLHGVDMAELTGLYSCNCSPCDTSLMKLC